MIIMSEESVDNLMSRRSQAVLAHDLGTPVPKTLKLDLFADGGGGGPI